MERPSHVVVIKNRNDRESSTSALLVKRTVISLQSILPVTTPIKLYIDSIEDHRFKSR